MKYLSYIFLFLAVALVSCGDDDEAATGPEYSITIMSPNAEAKKVGDSFHIHINFDEASLMTVHHINVQIVEKDNESNVIYSAPAVAHVHAESGHYEHHDDFVLDGVAEHTDWILKAKVWGHEAGFAEVEKDLEFHVHPM